MESEGRVQMRRHLIGAFGLLLTSSVLTLVSFAVQLPVKTYTTGEGLPRDEVTLIRQDSRGFIWVAAGDGVSRFDPIYSERKSK